TGAYKFAGGDFNTRLKWTAMPADFVTPRGPATVKNLEVAFIPDPATRSAALKSGDVDVIDKMPVGLVGGLASAGFTVGVDPGTSALAFLLDSFKAPTFDVRVRQAINYAVDKASIVKNLLSGYGDLDGQLI